MPRYKLEEINNYYLISITTNSCTWKKRIKKDRLLRANLDLWQRPMENEFTIDADIPSLEIELKKSGYKKFCAS